MMKYLVSLIVGMLVGAALLLGVLYYNPFVGKQTVSPLMVSDARLIDLSYSPASADALAVTNDGEGATPPVPEAIAELWEPAIRDTRVLVTSMTDSQGDFAGIGIKFSTDSENTRLLHAEAMVDSVWHVWLPDSGSLFVNETENLWPYLRNVVVPARLSSSDAWRGTWYGITTSGPRALGTAEVTGGSGRFSGVSSEATESINARAWSGSRGPVAMTGNLLISVRNFTAD